MRCSKCGAENREGARFCSECAAPFSLKCPACAAINKPGAKFCDECGASLSARLRQPEPQPEGSLRLAPEQSEVEVPEGERKTVTALFADIKGSTELMEDLDPEEARTIVDPALKLMIDAVHRYDGYVVQSTGDGIFALFGAPLAHEDHPQLALYAALQMRDALREYGAGLNSQRGRALLVRIGVNTGEVVVRHIETSGRAEYTAIGHTANLASRMQAVAPVGTIAIGEPTKAMVEGYFELRALGLVNVKGIKAPVSAYEVVAAGPLRSHFALAARRGLTKFVGREHQLVQIVAALEQLRLGRGQVVATVGEAGAGKSRLMHEFKLLVPRGCAILEAYSVSHGKAAPWLPVIELLGSYFELAEHDDEQQRSYKIRGKVQALEPVLADTLPYIESLLGLREAAAGLKGMDSQIRRRRTLDALKRLFIRESVKQPLILIFEDLHWIDSETQQLLDALVDSVAGAALLLLVNYRPEYDDRWSSLSHYCQIRLDPLDGVGSDEMLAALIGEAPDVEPLKRLVASKTEGNPFFIEEIVQALFEQGVLARNGEVHLARALGEVSIPPTVQGILASRIDRLPTEQKELLQTLAVLGKDFALPLVRILTRRDDEELRRLLSYLESRDFVYEQGASPDREYTFKHALTQEVAYGSMLIERRRRLHLQAAKAIGTLYNQSLDRRYDDLIRHYERGGEPRLAGDYLQLASTQAFELSEFGKLLRYIRHGLELAAVLPEKEERVKAELQGEIGLASILGVTQGWNFEEIATACRRALELGRATGDEAAQMSALNLLRVFHASRGELRKAAEVAGEHLATAIRLSDPVHEAWARSGLGEVSFLLGQFALARAQNERATAIYDTELQAAGPWTRDLGSARALRELRPHCASAACAPLWTLGFPDQARIKSAEAIRLAQDADLHVLAWALWHTTWTHLDCGEIDAASERIDHLVKMTSQHGLNPGFLLWANLMRALLLLCQGRTVEVIATLRDIPWPVHMPLALAYARAGEAESAFSEIKQAFEEFSRNEASNQAAEVHRAMGEILLIQPEPDEAEAERWLRTAIEIACDQAAKSLELRATMSLARWLDKRGRRDEAREMLTDIYGWFTEGFDTADLKQAKALLEQLSR